ncbi:hypothetical protein ACLOJK_015528 [Asimina triloba]
MNIESVTTAVANFDDLRRGRGGSGGYFFFLILEFNSLTNVESVPSLAKDPIVLSEARLRDPDHRSWGEVIYTG